MDIVVIGPDPPCIRCTTTMNRAVEVKRQFPENHLQVRKIFVHSSEAEKYGKVECGHEIEVVGNVKPDSEGMQRVFDELDLLKADEEGNANKIDRLLKELDEAILPVRRRAEELGYLMTPVVVVNDKVKSAGYVPAQQEIELWVKSELHK